MHVLGFSHVNLRAPWPLLLQLRDFYVNVVGLREGERPPFASRGFWLYAGGQEVLHLSEAREGEARGLPPQGSPGTYDHLALRCEGLGHFEALLKQRGIPYRRAEVPVTGQVQLFVQDPSGNGVELNFDAA